MGREQMISMVREGQRFLVGCHRRPDADALGSAIGFSEVLRALGKEAVLVVPDELAFTLRYLPGIDRIVRSFDAIEGTFQGMFVMDTASASLLPKAIPPRSVTGPLVVIDHHAAFDDFADVVVRDSNMSSTGELILDIARELGVVARDLSIEGATALYSALVADTGGFRYSSTKPRTLRFAADLLEVGVDPWLVAYNLFEGWPAERVALLQEALAGLEFHFEGRLAVMHVSKAMLARTRATADMTDGLVQFARQVRGVDVAALLWEQDAATSDYGTEPTTKVSLRAAGKHDISGIAVKLGGGGHRAAAAASVKLPVDQVRTTLLAEAARLFGV